MTDTRSALKIRKDVGGMNMTEQHTPGPWRADNLAKVRSIYDDGKGLVADCGDGRYALPRDSNICHANARLIAAAPETAAERDRLLAVNAELFAALIFARRIMGSGDPITDDVLEPIDAAIARAIS